MKIILYGIYFILAISINVWAQNESNVQVEALAKTGSSWNGDILPEYESGQPEVTIVKVIIPPKIQLPLHKHPVINAGVILKGNLMVVTEDKDTLHLKSGDSIVEVVNKWHYGTNVGNEPTEIIVFYAGVQGAPITIRKADRE